MHGNGLCVTIKYSKGWERVALMINENNNSMLCGVARKEHRLIAVMIRRWSEVLMSDL